MNVASPPGIDLAALTRWMDREWPGLRCGDLAAEVLVGGRSNLTYRVTDDSSVWVLRRPPLGHVLPSAHDMAREYRLIGALSPTPVPVATPLGFCDREDVLGSPFYLMSYVVGDIYIEGALPAALTATEISGLYELLVDALALLHDVDADAAGLGDLGRPEGYLDRQVRRWQGQWERSETKPLPEIHRVIELLNARVPRSPAPAIVHGDFRLGNVIVAPAHDSIAAVVDWEMATLGDPLADLGLLLTYLRFADDERMPDREALVERYGSARDVDLSDIAWYVGLGNFKLAVIAEGIHRRFLAGQTVGAGFERIGDAVPGLVNTALRELGEGE